MANYDYQTFEHDVVVIGAGGAGLRAAIESSAQGCTTALICKSLLGKAHTVMAEGGAAAAMGNVDPNDNWQVHFRDTMRGGKFLNNYRMAELHAKESPDRILELERWGAVFDRTKDGRILQRNFGGHRFPRLAHVGDRTGLEIIRTLQDKGVHMGIDVYMEHTVIGLLKTDGRVVGCVAYDREKGRFKVYRGKAVVLATGGIGKAWRITSNSWEYTGDGHAMAYRAGADLVDMEFVQFHPTGMVWPPSVRGILVTESVRGEGGVLRNSQGERFMFEYIPELFRKETSDTEDEANRWLVEQSAATRPDPAKAARRPPELLPRDEVARAIHAEVKAGRGSPHGGVFLDVATRRTPEEIRRKLPSMYHQFKELAGVDITREAMEIGPTCHYVMGGIRVDADTQMSSVPGLFAAGECAGGLHGANRLGGNSLSDLLVFGRRAGLGAAEYAKASSGQAALDAAKVDSLIAGALAFFDRTDGPSPYDLAARLQASMEENVGIIRVAADLEKGLSILGEIAADYRKVRVVGNREFNPGWHLAIDMQNMLTVSEACARAALTREESRGGHTRNDFPATDKDHWGKVNLVIRQGSDGQMQVVEEPLPEMPPELARLFED
ncbi:MAG: fumarate reductase/succinate dehydrogenase flavoprotein subunit [Candidatus Sericytochromatia bacterium]|nr:fumarate reductase/succinate dehydrogenase flavoprotein subunit [Candidatus Tanganyikabacteria bacterium]